MSKQLHDVANSRNLYCAEVICQLCYFAKKNNTFEFTDRT